MRGRRVIMDEKTDAAFSKLRITIEPFGFLFVTATVLQTVVTQNLHLFKVCVANFGFNVNDCDVRNQTLSPDERNNSKLLDQIQSYVSTLNIYGSLIEYVPSAIFVFFLGPYIEKHDRKMLMVSPLIGQTLSTLIHMANYYVVSLPAEYLLFADVPVGLFGGMITFTMALNTYIMDVTPEETRMFRLALVAGVNGFAIPISQFISVPIYKEGSYLAIWLTALGLYFVAFIYVIFFVTTDPKKIWEEKGSKVVARKFDPSRHRGWKRKTGEIYNGFFVLKNLLHCFKITFQRREGYKRAIIFLLMFCFLLNLFSAAEHGVTYLYVRKKFSWNLPNFSLYIALSSLLQLFGTVLLLPLLTGILGLPDGAIGISSLIGMLFSYLLMSFATSSEMVYLSTLGHLLILGITVVIRTFLSTTVKSDEISRVFAVAACMESIVPLVASATYNLVYKATLSTFPGSFYLIETATKLMLMALFIVILVMKKKDQALNDARPRPAISYYSTAPGLRRPIEDRKTAWVLSSAA